MKNAINSLALILVALVVGVLLSRQYLQTNILPHHDVQKEANIITEKIENVRKMVLVEANFSEVFSYKDAYKMFYDYLSFEKKAILKVTAKTAISIDMQQLKYELDTINRRLFIYHIPDPELLIEPDIQYYDIQESSFNAFSAAELTEMNRDAVEQIRAMIKHSHLYDMARDQVVDAIKDLQLISNYMDWEVIDQTQLKSFDELQVSMPDQ